MAGTSATARCGHGLGGVGPQGPRAATAAVGALLVLGSSKLCAGLGGRLLTVSPLFSFLQTIDQVSRGREALACSKCAQGEAGVQSSGEARGDAEHPAGHAPAASKVGGGGPRGHPEGPRTGAPLPTGPHTAGSGRGSPRRLEAGALIFSRASLRTPSPPRPWSWAAQPGGGAIPGNLASRLRGLGGPGSPRNFGSTGQRRAG